MLVVGILVLMERSLLVFQALADPTRYAVFNCVRCCGGASTYGVDGCCDGGEPSAVSLCDVKCQVPCSPSTLSHHVSVLKAAGLVDCERIGRKLSVRLRRDTLEHVSRFLMEVK